MEKKLQIGAQGPTYPPMHLALQALPRIEAQGWDYLNFPDQLPPPFPEGLCADPCIPPEDVRAIISCISTVYFGSLELQTAASVLTNRIGVHVAVIDALRRNPALFAQELATINHISQGRARWAIGTGESKQFEPYGETRTKPQSRTEEALRIMHALWDSGGRRITRPSEFWPLKDAVFPVPLYNGQRPKIMLVGGGKRLLELTGELADGWLTFLPGGTNDSIELLAQTIQTVKRAAVEHGRDPDALEFNAKIHLVLAENDEVAWDIARLPPLAYSAMTGSMQGGAMWKEWGFKHPLGFDETYNWANNFSLELMNMPASAFAEVADQVPSEMTDHFLVWGGPERVAARIQAFVDAGLTHISFNNFVPWAVPSEGVGWARCASAVMELLGHAPLRIDV